MTRLGGRSLITGRELHIEITGWALILQCLLDNNLPGEGLAIILLSFFRLSENKWIRSIQEKIEEKSDRKKYNNTLQMLKRPKISIRNAKE